MKRTLDQTETARAEELLGDRALYGLTPAELAELAELGADADESFDLAAAAIDLASLPGPFEALPAGLADKILAAAPAALAAAAAATAAAAPAPGALASAANPTPAPTSTPTAATAAAPGAVATAVTASQAGAAAPAEAPVIPLRRARAPVYAWIAMAACLTLALGAVLWARGQEPEVVTKVVVQPPPPEPPPPTPTEARAQLLAAGGDAATLPWSATGDPSAKGAAGDVVWSPSKQVGFMRFVGLAPNDPNVSQYQLWIFDRVRDEKFPVDGGVFDVSASGEVIVQISPKLRVSDATLFAITVEKPGGVVVSKRERIVLTAAPAKPG